MTRKRIDLEESALYNRHVLHYIHRAASMGFMISAVLEPSVRFPVLTIWCS